MNFPDEAIDDKSSTIPSRWLWPLVQSGIALKTGGVPSIHWHCSFGSSRLISPEKHIKRQVVQRSVRLI
jgi:hypothetical protein